MMTSRSEYRLTLRQDNADERLTPIGREWGLVDNERWAAFTATHEAGEKERRRLETTTIRAAQLEQPFRAAGLEPPGVGGTAAALLKRPEVSYRLLAQVIGWGEGVDKRTAGRIETEIKYEGYIARQQRQIQEVKRQEATLIPADFDYAPLSGLRLEAREKLAAIRPANLAQAGRIPGVSEVDKRQELYRGGRGGAQLPRRRSSPPSAAAGGGGERRSPRRAGRIYPPGL